jgi:hypothetical protein
LFAEQTSTIDSHRLDQVTESNKMRSMEIIHQFESHVERIRGREEQQPAVSLIIGRGDTPHPVRPIDKPLFVIGRAPDCDLVLGDSQIADFHAYILRRGGHITLRHLGAAPNVTVNQRWLRWGEIRHGDRIRTGPYEFTLRVVPRMPAGNQDKRENPNALENLSILGRVSSTEARPSSDQTCRPICWADGRHPPVSLFPTKSLWNNVPGMSRLLDWW